MSDAPTHPPLLVRAELLISSVLRYGVLLCGTIMASGIVLLLVRPSPSLTGDVLTRLRDNDPAVLAAAPRTLAEFTQGLAILDPNIVIALGVVLLIALPIVRVALTVVIFVLERDWVYLLITLLVLSVLLVGIYTGAGL